MSEKGPMHQLHRAVEELTLGVVQPTQRRDDRNYELGLHEHQEQFQITVSGTTYGLGFAEIEVEFDNHFFYAPGQRDSDLDRPHFSFGSECEAEVVMVASVKDWNIRAHNGAIRGATVRLAILTISELEFEAVLHMTFQGFASLDEDGSSELDV